MNKKTIKFLLGLFGLGLCVGCQDKIWDDHYGIVGTTETRNLMQVLENMPECASFCNVLKNHGFDSLLVADQTFTVWVPTNEAMAGFVENEETENQFLQNHISRYLYGQVELADTSYIRMKMLNGKLQEYKFQNQGYTFAGVPVVGPDIAASNGIIHTIASRAPFYYNLYEKICQPENQTDSVAKFLTSFDKYTFNESKSTAIGKDKFGQVVYDSVFDFKNAWLSRYGLLNNEDSMYTMIVPTNDAWKEGYARLSSYFRTFGESFKDTVISQIIPQREYAVSSALSDSLTDSYIKQNLCMDLVFRKTVDFLQAPGDSLLSTSGNVFHHPIDLLEGADLVPVSNGRIWQTEQLRYKPEETFLKPIVVEAELTSGRESNYAVISSRSSSNTIFRDSVSEQRYIEVQAVSENPRQQPTVQFTIPNTLAAKYNVYCIFAPSCAYMDGVKADSTKVSFYLNYVHEDGKMYEDDVIEISSPTNGTQMTKMFVTQINLPFANYSASSFSGPLQQDNDCVKLRVQTNVDRNETTKFTRIMRIDRIIFEPVIE